MSLKRIASDVLYTAKKQKKSKEVEPELDDDVLKAIGEALSAPHGGSRHSDKKITRDTNHIYYYSEVDRDSIFDLCSLISEVEDDNIFTAHKMKLDPIPIYLHINSYGGSIFAAFAAIDAINACKVPIYTIIEGAVASAGTLISVFGKKRYIRPHAYMLIHQLSSGFWGKMSEIDDEHKNLVELTERILTIYREHTKIPKKELQELLRHDLWLNTAKALKYGLVDEVYN